MDDSGSSSSSDTSSNDSTSNDTARDDVAQSSDERSDMAGDTSPASTDPDISSVESHATTTSRPQARPAAPSEPHTSPGLIILQWLTYAFWGWTLLAFIWLAFIVIASFMTPFDTSGMVPYAIAASLVLLPIAVLCDVFYLRKEPAKKHGAAMVVMVIHAVIFALFGIGILITGVVTLINLSIDTPSDPTGHIAWILTAFLSVVVYLLAFLRTLNPLPNRIFSKWFWLVMTILVAVLVVMSFIGPVTHARLAREDDKIETALERIDTAIRDEVERTGKQPQSLGELSLETDQKALVDKGVVTYVPEGEVRASRDTADNARGEQTYKSRYQLCATFHRQGDSYGGYEFKEEGGYNSYLSPSNHTAGKTCYKLQTEEF